MADANTFTLGVPTQLLERSCLGGRTWKQQKKKLLYKGPRLAFSMTFKKLPNRLLEPWQRAGFWLTIDAAVTLPSVAKILGLRPTTALLTGGLYPPTGANPTISHSWNTHDDSPEQLATAVGQRLAPIIDAVLDALEHEAGFESAAWEAVCDRFTYDGGIEVSWPTPHRGVSTGALPLSPPADNRAEACAYYAAALLDRQDHFSAASWLEQLSAEETEGALWDAVRGELTRQQQAGLEARPLAACDWDLAALEAEIAERRSAALLADPLVEAGAGPDAAQSSSAPVSLAAPTAAPAAGSIWEVLTSAIRPASYRAEEADLGPGNDVPAVFEWESLCAGLDRLSPEEREAFPTNQPALEAALEALPDRYRRTVVTNDLNWVEAAAGGSPPLGWPLARSLALESDVTLASPLTSAMRHLHIYDASELGRVAALELPQVVQAEFAWSDLTLALLEQLFSALPALHSVSAEIPDAELAALAKAEVAERVEELRSTHSRAFDKGLKALARRKDLSRLRRLSLAADVKAPAIKALAKAPWAPQLESLTIGRSSPAGCGALISALSGPLAGLRAFTLRTDVELGGAALPPGVESLHIQPSYAGLDSCIAANPDLPLRRLVLDGYGIELPIAESLVGWPATGGLEELSLTVHASDDSPYRDFFERLGRNEWPALRSVALQLYEPDDSACGGLAAWLSRCPQLQSLRLHAYQPTVTVGGARELAAAVQGVRVLEAQLPPMIEVLGSQGWPQLVALRLSLQPISSELAVPIRPAALMALGQMPALRMAAISDGQLADGADDAVQALREVPHLLTLQL